MQMTEYEIRQNYKLARNKREQIKILAELNSCTRADIIRILDGGSVADTRKVKHSQRGKRLDEETRREMLEEYLAGGITISRIAEKYGLAYSTALKYIQKQRKDEGK